MNIWFGLSDTVTINITLGPPFLLEADAVSMYKSCAFNFAEDKSHNSTFFSRIREIFSRPKSSKCNLNM